MFTKLPIFLLCDGMLTFENWHSAQISAQECNFSDKPQMLDNFKLDGGR